jgi:hypothetical protein
MTISVNDLPDHDYKTVLAEYREQFPLLRHYLDVIDEARPATPLPITEPHDGVDVMEATRIACERAGYIVTHADQYHWAYQQIRTLQDEISHRAVEEPATLDGSIIRYYFAYMACIPTPDEWLEQIEEQKIDDAAEWVQSIADDPKLLADLAYIAMPELLRLTIARDAKAREGDDQS